MNHNNLIDQYKHVSQTTQSNYLAIASIFQRCKNMLKKAKEHNSKKHFLQRTQEIIEIMNEMKKTNHIRLFSSEPEIAKNLNEINASMYNMVHDLVTSGAESDQYDPVIKCFEDVENFFLNSNQKMNIQNQNTSLQKGEKNGINELLDL
ncbi:MAG: hypothetical protein SFT68_00045 [Rickettsiaceae bacterium]|nr:hypothetical protein [Rickettsiaceae bacterium]